MMGGMINGFEGCGYGAAGGFIGLFLNIIILAGLVLLVIWAVKQFTRSGSAKTLFTGNAVDPHPLSAREILDIRYAKGELTREQYQKMVQDLS